MMFAKRGDLHLSLTQSIVLSDGFIMRIMNCKWFLHPSTCLAVYISSLGAAAAAAAVGTTTAHVICRYYTRCVINKTNGIRIKRGCISSRLLIINSYFHGCITINSMWNEVQQHKICNTLPSIHIHGKCISAHPIFAR